MNLPFTPTFLRRMEIYQQLVEYDSQKKTKRLWGGEKAFLIWAGSEHHQHLGSAVGKDHLKNALNYCLEKGFISEEEKEEYLRNGRHIVESLLTHNMATLDRYADEKNPRIKINKNGILAGQILAETNNFQNTSIFDWQYKISRIKAETILSILAIFISIFGLTQGQKAIKIAERDSDLNQRATELQAEDFQFTKDGRSQKYVEDVFNALYQEESNLEIIQKVRSNKKVEDKVKLTYVIDYLESTGSSFCQGTVWKWHLNTTLKNTLEDVCSNDQVFDEFAGRKNGLAMLCREFFPNSKFSQTLQTYNLNTCVFHDSSELKTLIENLQR